MAEPKLPPLPAVDPEERIVTMPERYYGAALAYTPGREAPSGAAPAAARAEGAARAARPPLWLFVVLGLALVGGIGFGVWWFLLRPPAAPAVNQPVANRNANASANRNANANLNANRNANVSAPATSTPPAATSTPINANRNTNVNAPAPAAPVRLALDTDADGLTDTEEAIYGADPAKPDTDADGFLDGVEVFNLYDPARGERATLASATSSVTVYAEAGYSLLAPATWRRQIIDAQSQSVAWLAATGEFVQTLIEDNPENLPIEDWYLERSPGVQRSQIQSFRTPSGLSGARSPDGFTSYVAIAPRTVLVITYSLGNRTEASFRRTYEMMANSVRATAATAPTGGGTSATSSATSTP